MSFPSFVRQVIGQMSLEIAMVPLAPAQGNLSHCSAVLSVEGNSSLSTSGKSISLCASREFSCKQGLLGHSNCLGLHIVPKQISWSGSIGLELAQRTEDSSFYGDRAEGASGG